MVNLKRYHVIIGFRMLNGILSSALEDGLVNQNVMTSKRITISTKETKRKALTVEQVRDILSGLHKLSLQERLLILLLLYTGMRRGEILALEWDHVDFENRLIHVNAAVDFENGNTPSLKGPKSEAGIRLLPILPPLMEALKEAHAVAQNVFVIGDHAVPLTKRAYECMFNRIRTSIDLHGATAHVFRHTFITMCSAYLDPKTTQSLAGHAKCDITLNRYAHAQERLIRAAGDDLAGIYNT